MFGDLDEDDAVLLTRLRAGDEASFAALVASWTPTMLNLAGRFVASREAAEDAVQETWLAVVAGLDHFEGRSSLRTWVVAILIRQAQRIGGREHRSIPFCSAWRQERTPTVDPDRFRGADAVAHPGGWALPLPRWDLLPDNHAQSSELRATLDRAISELPRRQQQVVTARDVWGCAANEVCDMLGLSANYQRVLLHRARAHLRDAVEIYLTGAAS